jgi:ATP-dependent Clp protease ATP-binding subunit ClpA
VIVFRALSKESIKEIVQLEIDKVSQRLEEHAMVINITPAALDLLAELGYDPEMGARPLRRVIQQEIEDAFSDALLAGKFEDGDTIVVDAVDDEITLYRSEENSLEQEEALAAG